MGQYVKGFIGHSRIDYERNTWRFSWDASFFSVDWLLRRRKGSRYVSSKESGLSNSATMQIMGLGTEFPSNKYLDLGCYKLSIYPKGSMYWYGIYLGLKGAPISLL